MTKIQVNINTKVNSKSIRREVHNGREHFVVPSYTMPGDVVMNGGLYPSKEIDANFHKLEGKFAPLGHPMVNGEYVSAASPEGLNVGWVGAWNRNVKKVGHRVYVEKWIDIAKANQSEDGTRLIDRLEQLEKGEGEPIHTSVAVYLDQVQAVNEDAGYSWIAHIHDIDHDAILLDQPGAATPEQGVGMMVNADDAKQMQTNAGALPNSYRDKEMALQQAARDRFAPEDYIYVGDFNDTEVVIVESDSSKLYTYRVSDGKVVIEGNGEEVQRQESWIKRFPAVNAVAAALSKFFSTNQARPENTTEGDKMPLTTEEKAELVGAFNEATKALITEAVTPLAQSLSDLQANHKTLSDTLTANQKAEEAEKRAAVAKKYGQEVADGLSVNALDAMYKQLESADKLNPNGALDKKDAEDFSQVID